MTGEDKRDEEKPRLREADKKIRRETQRKRPSKEGAPRKNSLQQPNRMMLVDLRDDVWSKRKTEGGGRRAGVTRRGRILIEPLPWEPLGALRLAPGRRTGLLARMAEPVRPWGKAGPEL